MNSPLLETGADAMTCAPNRYGRIARLLHWSSAVLIVVLIGSGFGAAFSNEAASKMTALRVHLPVAFLVFVLTIIRLVWWRIDKKPAPISGGPAWQRVAADWTHRALYLALIVMLGSGIALSLMTSLPPALFGGAAMPDLSGLAPRIAHGIAGLVLVALIILHLAASLYHQFIVRDETLARMWPGRD
ncbi:cytochrome b/b6 domain-containing protein [uncultured Cohaesibacter sp.]|uniref:cytochrome b n=1 Tax=uncultured Cohaesibacter sp. TaxID=1002546 RepID=UPI0029C6E14B|nr:cytochrome b/b6 domain-containing protein [uncultured Cohaesibacter sp.]